MLNFLHGKDYIDCFLLVLDLKDVNSFFILFWTSNLFAHVNIWILSTNGSRLTNISECNLCQLDLCNFWQGFEIRFK